MNSLTLTIRALTTEFARRIILPLFVIGLIILTTLIAATAWLTTLSGWWWILLSVCIIISAVFVIVSVVAITTMTAIKPRQTRAQRAAVKEFVNKLQAISDTIQTPKFVILFRIIWDAVNKNDNGLVRTLSSHTTTTKSDFDAIRRSFENNFRSVR